MSYSIPLFSGSMAASDRRRSADVGGLHLAMRTANGQGWLGGRWSDATPTRVAELLVDMYDETLRTVESNATNYDPPVLKPERRAELLKLLDNWFFEPLHMVEDEVLSSVLFIFEVLFRIEGFQETIKVPREKLPNFITHIRQMYRLQNHYHNFEHAVDVLQAIHYYLCQAGMVPPLSLLLVPANAPGGAGKWKCRREPDSGPLVTSLSVIDIFALYLAALGHDVGHPGFNNPFMENAKAPLSEVYNNQSALEQMHSVLLLKTMQHHGFGVLLDDSSVGQHFRKILKSSVLATDMSIHGDFMAQFATALEGTDEDTGVVQWNTTRCSRQTIICHALLKNADISNPCRPFEVSTQWASALQQEWTCQFKFELDLKLIHSVNPSNGPLTEAQSQVGFTSYIVKPLIELTAIAIPELRKVRDQCRANLEQWTTVVQSLKSQPPPPPPPPLPPLPSSLLPSLSPTSTSPPITTTTSTLTSVPQIAPTTPSDSSTSSFSISSSTSVSKNKGKGKIPVSIRPPSISSSSNTTSPRISDNTDYSNAFRLALPARKPTAQSSYFGLLSSSSLSPPLSSRSPGDPGLGINSESNNTSASGSPTTSGYEDLGSELAGYRFPAPIPLSSASSGTTGTGTGIEMDYGFGNGSNISNNRPPSQTRSDFRVVMEIGIGKQQRNSYLSRKSWGPDKSDSNDLDDMFWDELSQSGSGITAGTENTIGVIQNQDNDNDNVDDNADEDDEDDDGKDEDEEDERIGRESGTGIIESGDTSGMRIGTRAVAQESDSDADSEVEVEDDLSSTSEAEVESEHERIPAGLVAPDEIIHNSNSDTHSDTHSDAHVDSDLHTDAPSDTHLIRTPPQQTGALHEDHDSLEGSPTPKAKNQGKPIMRESTIQKAKRLEEEEKKRQKIIAELIKSEEEEQRKKEKRNGGGSNNNNVASGSGKSRARSRSKGRKKKGKGKK